MSGGHVLYVGRDRPLRVGPVLLPDESETATRAQVLDAFQRYRRWKREGLEDLAVCHGREHAPLVGGERVVSERFVAWYARRMGVSEWLVRD